MPLPDLAEEKYISYSTDMPLATQNVIVSSGNYSNTLFIFVSNASMGIASTSPIGGHHEQPIVQRQGDNVGCINFVELTGSPAFDIKVNAVEGYRSVIRAALQVASSWREKRRMSTPAALWVKENQSLDTLAVPLATRPSAERRLRKKSANPRRSMSFGLLSTASAKFESKIETTENFDAIITYLPHPEASGSESGFQALLTQFYAATTAISTVSNQSLRKEDMGSLPDGKGGFKSSTTTLLYVLPAHFPTSLPRTLQSYLASLLSADHQTQDSPRVFLVQEKTLDRKMQRQEGRHPVTGLEIILSNSLRWERPTLPTRPATINIFLDDFKHCRFKTSPSSESYDTSSATASYSSLSNMTTTTTDGEPQTPTLSDDEDSVLAGNTSQVIAQQNSEPFDYTLQSLGTISTPDLGIKSAKKAPFLRRIFSGDRAR